MARSGIVYLMVEPVPATRETRTKIGWTTRTANERARDGTLGPSGRWRVVQEWRCDDAPRLEKLVHQRLDRVRLRGEWFSVDAASAAEIVERLAAIYGLQIG